jgi:hypothetical protein
LRAAHISTTEAYDVDGDVREVNIRKFDDPLPWDVMPTGMSDIPTQFYGSADFQSQQSNDYVHSRTFSVVKSNESQPESKR